MMIDFEDRAPPAPLSLGDRLVLGLAVAVTAHGLWFLGAQGWAAVQWAVALVR